MYRRLSVLIPSPATAVALAALLAAGTGLAVAAGPTSPVIQACANRKTGALRLAKKCRHSEHSVRWNQQGVQGRPGVPGAPGPGGSNGTNATVNGVVAGGDLAGTYPNPAIAPPEPLHVVGQPGQPAFEGGWSNFENSYTKAAFYKDRLGIVHLDGLIQNATGKTTAFTLPPGYRPAGRMVFGAWSTEATPSTSSVLVTINGEVFPECTKACNISLATASFRAGG